MEQNLEQFSLWLRNVSWFSNVGHQVVYAGGVPIGRTLSWGSAIKCLRERETYDFLIKSQNDLYHEQSIASYAKMSQRASLVEFRKTSRTIQEVIDEVKPLIYGAIPADLMAKEVRDYFNWILFMCGVFVVYRNDILKSTLCHDLMELFRMGHFACGWQGDYPSGNLIVF